nr:retrovirus-related Pol polyprotein from transposon TNT 1-94 [Tanacetum cinerariifolium]
MFLMQAQENGMTLDEEHLLFIAGGQDNAVDDDVDEQPIHNLALNVDNVFQADDCDAFDFDVDDALTVQTMFMANLSSADPVYDDAGSSYDSDVLSEVHDHDHYQDAIFEHHEVHEMHDDVKPNYVVGSHTGYMSDSNMIPKAAIGYKSLLCLARAKQVQPALYNGHEIIKTDHVLAIVHNLEDTLEIAEITRKKMNEKMKTSLWTHHKINIRPPDYSKENFLLRLLMSFLVGVGDVVTKAHNSFEVTGSTRCVEQPESNYQEKQLVLEMIVDESLKMIVDESLDMIEDESLDMIKDESLDMIVDESLMVEDKSLEKLMDETLKLDEYTLNL